MAPDKAFATGIPPFLHGLCGRHLEAAHAPLSAGRFSPSMKRGRPLALTDEDEPVFPNVWTLRPDLAILSVPVTSHLLGDSVWAMPTTEVLPFGRTPKSTQRSADSADCSWLPTGTLAGCAERARVQRRPDQGEGLSSDSFCEAAGGILNGRFPAMSISRGTSLWLSARPSRPIRRP